MSEKRALSQHQTEFATRRENTPAYWPLTTFSGTRWCDYIPHEMPFGSRNASAARHHNSHQTRRWNTTRKNLNAARKQPESSPVPSGYEGLTVDSNLPVWYR